MSGAPTGAPVSGTEADFVKAQGVWRSQLERGEITTEEFGQRLAGFEVAREDVVTTSTQQKDSVQGVLEQYDKGKLASEPDVAEAIEALENAPEDALKAVDKYRREHQESIEKHGLRMDDSADILMEELRAIAKAQPSKDTAYVY